MPNHEATTQARVDAAVAAEKQRIADVRAAVDRARPLLPSLPTNYADEAVASGRNLDQVKGALTDLMCARSPREQSKANMLAQVAAMPGAGKAAPESDAGRSRANMEKLIRSRGQEPVKR